MMPDAEEWYRELCAEYGVLTERQVAALAPRNDWEPSRKSVYGLGGWWMPLFKTMVNPQAWQVSYNLQNGVPSSL